MHRSAKNTRSLFWIVIAFVSIDCSNGKKIIRPEYSDIQKRYADSLKVHPDEIANEKLYMFIDEWMHTPYLFGGDSKKGLDCSALIRRILKEVYAVELPRVSVDQFLDKRIIRHSSMKYLNEGDLVFFTFDSNKTVSHVGMYLQNGRFINCDTKGGVCIRNLKSSLWKNSVVAYGRLKSI